VSDSENSLGYVQTQKIGSTMFLIQEICLIMFLKQKIGSTMFLNQKIALSSSSEKSLKYVDDAKKKA